MQGVPDAFREKFADTVADWATEFSDLYLKPSVLGKALSDIESTSRFFPTKDQILTQVLGEGWDKKLYHFIVPSVVWETVIDLSSGRVLEVYPLVLNGTLARTRTQIAREGKPSYDAMLQEKKAQYADGRLVKEQAASMSRSLGYEVKAGGLSTERRSNVWGSGSPAKAQEEAPSVRSDLKEQIERLKSSLK